MYKFVSKKYVALCFCFVLVGDRTLRLGAVVLILSLLYDLVMGSLGMDKWV